MQKDFGTTGVATDSKGLMICDLADGLNDR